MASAIVYPDDGLVQSMDTYTLNLVNQGTLHLYSNDYTPGTGTVAGSFTEASFTGYSSISMSGVFTGSSLSGHKAVETAPMQTFTCSADLGSPVTVYGWYILDSSGIHVLAASRAETPVVVEFTDDEVRVQITMTEKDENE